MALYHQIVLKEPLKYIFNHGIIPMYFTQNHTAYINLLEFFPLLKSGVALYDTMINMFFIYAKYNQLIVDDNVKINLLLSKAFSISINTLLSPEEIGALTHLYSTPVNSGYLEKLCGENTIMKNIQKSNKQMIYIASSLFYCDALLTNPYIKVIDEIRRTDGYINFKNVDLRRYQYEIYHYAKVIQGVKTYTTIACNIKKEIIITTWLEREVFKTCIERLIGPSTIPQEIHYHLLNYIVN